MDAEEALEIAAKLFLEGHVLKLSETERTVMLFEAMARTAILRRFFIEQERMLSDV